MKSGDIISCRAPRGYFLTLNKEYTVIKYQPESRDFNFTWPAYVKVADDNGKEVWCHAHRFNDRGYHYGD